jgi:hypothetical protein
MEKKGGESGEATETANFKRFERYPSGEQALFGYPVNVVECMGAQENATGQTGTITWSA